MYTEKDCEPCDGSQCLIDRVVVLRQEEKSGQIFLCLGGEGSGILAERGGASADLFGKRGATYRVA